MNKGYIKYVDCTHNYLPIYCGFPQECDVSVGIKTIHGVGDSFFKQNGTLLSMLANKIKDVIFRLFDLIS